MFGKVNNALIRREADAYRAQGLQEEALRLFHKILASPAKLPPDVKKGIEQQVLEIEAEIARIDLEERQQVSEEQIAVIKQGWSENAVIDDFVVCARELHALGRHGDALEEFRRSIQKGYSPHRVIAPVADCLIHLHGPQEMPGHVKDLAGEMFQDPKETFNFMLSLAEQMLKDGNREHAAALGRHLAESNRVPHSYRTRLDAVLNALRSSRTKKKSIPAIDHPAPTGSILFRFILRWIRNAFRFFASRD
jgi:tetratricopeptide (TPR) repeat protein